MSEVEGQVQDLEASELAPVEPAPEIEHEAAGDDDQDDADDDEEDDAAAEQDG